MTEGIMTMNEFSRRRGCSNRKTLWMSVVAFMVFLIVGITVGVVVGGNNKDESNPQQQQQSLSDGGKDDPDRLVASPAPSASVLSPTDPPSATEVASDTPPPSTVVSITDPPTTAPITTATATESPGTIVSGATTSGMPYLRCSSESDNADLKQVVLLHGSAFDKEVWLDHDMLPQFCAGAEMVVALDFPVSTNYQGLMQVLDDLRDVDEATGRALITKPVTLVTPSASGFSVVSWIMGGDITILPSYIVEWVPVAPVSLVSASDEQLLAVTNVPDFSILAINGNEDRAGGKYSTRLADLSEATAVELVGRHAVYLQSPDEFVQTILNFSPDR